MGLILPGVGVRGVLPEEGNLGWLWKDELEWARHEGWWKGRGN